MSERPDVLATPVRRPVHDDLDAAVGSLPEHRQAPARAELHRLLCAAERDGDAPTAEQIEAERDEAVAEAERAADAARAEARAAEAERDEALDAQRAAEAERDEALDAQRAAEAERDEAWEMVATMTAQFRALRGTP